MKEIVLLMFITAIGGIAFILLGSGGGEATIGTALLFDIMGVACYCDYLN